MTSARVKSTALSAILLFVAAVSSTGSAEATSQLKITYLSKRLVRFEVCRDDDCVPLAGPNLDFWLHELRAVAEKSERDIQAHPKHRRLERFATALGLPSMVGIGVAVVSGITNYGPSLGARELMFAPGIVLASLALHLSERHGDSVWRARTDGDILRRTLNGELNSCLSRPEDVADIARLRDALGRVATGCCLALNS